MKAFSLVIVAFALSACSTVLNRAVERSADAVELYCESLGERERNLYGDAVRREVEPHSIEVMCAGDTD